MRHPPLRRWNQQPQARVRLAPISISLMVTLIGAIAIAGGLLWAALAWLGPPARTGRQATVSEVLEIIKIALAVVAGVGGVVALVVAYRKQRVTEASEQRELVRLYAERFDKAADKLGSESPTVRLAGVHAIAALADDWAGGRQMCIDVLCAYLRMPTAPKPDDADTAASALWKSMAEVRATVLRLISSHLLPDALTPWHGYDLDFTDVTFDAGASFREAVFSRGLVSFSGATFPNGTVDFNDAVFAGSVVRFTGATFSGGTVSFRRANFSAGRIDFDAANLSTGVITFESATFGGARVRFSRTNLSGGRIVFDAANFSRGTVGYHEAAFSGTKATYAHADFSGGFVSFGGADFSAGEVDFDGAIFSAGAISFAGTTFSGGKVQFDGTTFRGGTVDFAKASFSGRAVDDTGSDDVPFLAGAHFTGGTVDLRLIQLNRRPIRLPEPAPGLLLPTVKERVEADPTEPVGNAAPGDAV